MMAKAQKIKKPKLTPAEELALANAHVVRGIDITAAQAVRVLTQGAEPPTLERIETVVSLVVPASPKVRATVVTEVDAEYKRRSDRNARKAAAMAGEPLRLFDPPGPVKR